MNPDPAVFEAAFVLDDGEDQSRGGTPKPSMPEDKAEVGSAAAGTEGTDASQQNGDKEKTAPAEGQSQAKKTDSLADLPPEIKSKLRKLEKLEATYPGELLYLSMNAPVSVTLPPSLADIP